MYTLYWRAGTAAFAPQAMLEEIGAPYEKVHIRETDAAQTSEEFRAVNPLGQVPALVLPDGTVMTESAAMTIYLADLKPELGLAPAPDDPARAVYLRWMVFMAAKLYQTFRHIYHTDAYTDDPTHIPVIKTTALTELERDWAVLEDALSPGPYLLSERFSAADIYLAMFPDWHLDPAGLLERFPAIARLHAKVLARPAVARVYEDHY